MLKTLLFSLGFFCVVVAIKWDDGDTREETSVYWYRSKREYKGHLYSPWPKAIVPYEIEPSGVPHRFEYFRIFAIYEDMSCIRFLPRKKNMSSYGLTHSGYMGMHHSGGSCATRSYGYEPYHGISCCTRKACMHELGHILGFPHGHQNRNRTGWVRVSWNNVKPDSEDSFNDRNEEGWPHDITSPMHDYGFTGGIRDGGLSVLFPELTITSEYFYFFKEIAVSYKCGSINQCAGKDFKCENAGFRTVLHGKCQCKCPTGLDPADLCRTPLKEVTNVSWPKGKYALLQMKEGCPKDGSFQNGQIIFSGIDGFSKPKTSHVKGSMNGKEADLNFCTRNVDDYKFDSVEAEKFNWPVGMFCIYMNGDKCPKAFWPHSFEYDVTSSVTNGQLPEGIFNNKKVKVKMCCQYGGFHVDPMLLPTEKPFSLIQFGGKCQEVTGMRWERDSFTIKSPNGFKTDGTTKQFLRRGGKSLTVKLCNYRKTDMKCGGSITLSKSKPVATIEMDATGRPDVECTWIIRGDNEDTNLVVDFDEFNVKKDGSKCHDEVEVRHSIIGHYGIKYCGEDLDHSIRSITNKLLVRFFTNGNTSSSFKATVRMTADEDMCYDVRTRGVHYDGSVNYTRRFEPCLPWASVPECYHNPFLPTDIFAGLDGNACRNPDNTFRPWCYTDRVGCKRNYCDVCGLEVRHDNVDNCDKLRDTGYCTRHVGNATKYCSKTCLPLLPGSKTPLRKYTEITCGKPTPPAESVIVGETKSSYKLGEAVQYKCEKSGFIISSSCMTSGNWSEIDCQMSSCPHGFALFDDTCFKSMYRGKLYTMKDATELCKSMGAELAVPHNYNQNAFMAKLAAYTRHWIGVNDIKKEGQWREPNGSLVYWTNWNSGEPNDAARGEDCAVMKHNGLWNDFPCSYKARVTCALPKRISELHHCEDTLGSKCLQRLTERPTMCKDYPEFAREYCRKTCRVCPGFDAKCSVQNTNPNVLTMTTKTTISVGESVDYKCERFSYPTKGSEHQACLPNGKLSGEPLECGQCPPGFKMFKNACHGIKGGRVFSRGGGQEYCSKLGGFLAMPKTKEESDVISSVGLGDKIWIGASDRVSEDVYRWDDDSLVTWTNWAPGEPKAKGKKYDCIVMNSDKTWTNVKCGEDYLTVVCTIRKSGPHLCYDKKDLGATYDGKVNITIANKPCASWAERNCPKSPFKNGYARYNLESNYCRNPDKSPLGPWCYTGNGCSWRYCDVCKSDSPNIVDIRCPPPTVPSDGKIVSIPRDSYKFGDVVTIQCKRSTAVATTTCLTSGNWSPMGTACTECPIGYSLFNDTCYSFTSKNLNYDDAIKECAKVGGHLPRPDNYEIRDFLLKMNRGRYMFWFDARRKSTDNNGIFRWSDGTIATWYKALPGFACGLIKPNGAWSSTRCDFIYSNLNVMCAVPKLDKPECRDFLEGQCQKWLFEKPTMCRDYKEFGKEFCTNTCGQCPDAAHCIVPSPKKYAYLMNKKSSIKSGDFVVYRCKRGKFTISGNTERFCLPNGQLSGSDVICGDSPPGYKKYNGVFYGLVNKNLQFNQAATECKKVNGYIASPKNEAENNFINSQYGRYKFWLGASDEKEEGKFVWQDGSKVEWSNWDRGEPNDWRRKEDCIVMLSNKKWNDRSCYGKHKVVCATPSIGLENCYGEDRGATYDGKVAVSENGKVCVPWATATHCRHNPFQKGDEQMNLVENYCRNPDKSLAPWCYTDADSCKKDYCKVCDGDHDKDVSKVKCPKPNIPSDGLIHDNVKTEYQVGERVKIFCKGSEQRGEVTTCLTSGHWSPVGLACSMCPSGYDYLKNQCYKFVDKELLFSDARKYCVKEAGGFIASPKTPVENEFIAKMRDNKEIWIGINDIETEGRWDREDGGAVTWANWAPGEPNDWGNEDYAVISRDTSLWMDRSQWATKPFVCQTHVTREKDSRLCEDLLLSQCQNHLAKDPGMCKKHTVFAVQYCTKTCDMCNLKDVQSIGQYMVGPTFTLTNGAKATPAMRAYFGTGNQYRIVHSGKIVAWEFYSESPIKTALQVWRKTNGRDAYQLVGQNVFTTGKDSSKQRYEVPEGSQIQVKKGDYLGIADGAAGGIRFNSCSGSLHPEFKGTFYWSDSVPSLQDFKVGQKRHFKKNGACVWFPFRAIEEF